MKLLFYNFGITDLLSDKSVNTGGACNLQFNLAQGLIKEGYGVGFLIYKGSSQKNFSFKEFDFIETYINKKFLLNKVAWFSYRIPILLKAIYLYRPDVIIHTGAGKISGVMCLIARVLNKTFVYFAVSDWESDGEFKLKASFLDRICFKYCLKYSDHIIVQNKYQKKNMKNVENRHTTILPTAYSLSYPEFNDFIKVKEPYVLWSANLRPAKGLEHLLKIAEELPSILFKVTGKQIYYGSKFNLVLSKLFLLPNIEYLGYLPKNKLYQNFQNASLLLNTSVREGFPTTFIEAWYYGVPVVTINYDPDKIISENKLGYICRDDTETIKTIREIIYGNVSINQGKIIQYVKEQHSPFKVAKKFIKILYK